MISVIIPVYNASHTLRQCVDSLLMQTYQDYELILVDDGSSDDSLSICKAYSSSCKNVHVIHQNNAGVSSARNLGLKRAAGELVTFVDSDDWVDRDYLESMVSPLSVHDSDLVISGFILDRVDSSDNYSFSDTFIHIDKEDASIFHSIFQSRLLYGPCCKLYKTDIIRRNRLFFPINLSYGEDRIFNYEYLSCIDTILVCSYTGYHYILNNPESLTSKKREDLFELEYQQWKSRWNLYTSRDLMTDQAEKDMLTELFWCINDNLALSNSFTFEKAYRYTKRLLSIPEIDLIKNRKSIIYYNKVICRAILGRHYLLATLLFRL